MIRRLENALLATGIAAFALVGMMAFMRRDHKVELIVTYHQSPPEAIWRLLTNNAVEPQWLPAFGSVIRQPDIGGHEIWTHTSPDQVFSFTVMTVSAILSGATKGCCCATISHGTNHGTDVGYINLSRAAAYAFASHPVWLDGRLSVLHHAARRRQSRRLPEVLRQPDRTGVERSAGDSGAAIALSPIPLSLPNNVGGGVSGPSLARRRAKAVVASAGKKDSIRNDWRAKSFGADAAPAPARRLPNW